MVLQINFLKKYVKVTITSVDGALILTSPLHLVLGLRNAVIRRCSLSLRPIIVHRKK